MSNSRSLKGRCVRTTLNSYVRNTITVRDLAQDADDYIYDDDYNSDIRSLLRPLIGLRSNSEVDSNEFSQKSEKI
ncbi:unnamed protein product [Brachionus calyciflorus]|uniref:Uncharacterized protein n=1 Tax=Brachionus calyciflorus TaxID=104777 RepID=A0A814CHF3_9BILA|nr:unnamed protein product [Brachionus calyciflorus]